MDEHDPIPDFIAGMDQLASGLKEWVRVLRSYYTEAVAEGFTSDQAFTLTIAYQAATLAKG